jgi:hypothetical protein
MAKRFSIASLVAAMIAFNVALLLAVASPVVAGEKPSKGRGGEHTSADHDGDADSNPGTGDTEDDDDNDGGTRNNVPDGGDNAHPSGKDRSVEHGSAGNQGKSESNPDDSKGPMRFEGELGDDKPNGPGGMDLADQDGNNGCGNDDDFDDDNNGWCGKRATNEPNEPERPCVDDMTTPTDECNPVENPDDDDEVIGGRVDRPGSDDDVRGKRIDPSSTGPESLDRPGVRGSVLPFTGGGVAPLLAAAAAVMAAGIAILRRRSRSAVDAG